VLVFFELHVRFFKVKTLNYKSTEPVFFQDMAVGGDLEFLRIFVIADSPTGQRIAIQIIKIGILLLQFRPKLVMLARVSPHAAGRLNCENGGCLGDYASVE
jgi:hypothetical protein